MDSRDIAIRTILGEAANEGLMGQAAVAHVLLNRAADARWPSSVAEVALQPQQFSAWNEGAGGNHLTDKYGPGSDPYEKAGRIYDAVAAGSITDPTGGATHYYSPAGMQALVTDGHQSNLVPQWWDSVGGEPVTIGGHIFRGQANMGPMDPTGLAAPEPEQGIFAQALDSFQEDPGQLSQGLFSMGQAPVAQITPRQVQAYTPTRRENPYLSLFQTLGA